MLFEFDNAAPLQEHAADCAFCATPMNTWSGVRELKPCQREATGHLSLETKQCPTCGWWTASRTWTRDWHVMSASRTLRDVQEWRACGVLKHLDLENLETPLQEVRDYLTVRYSERVNVNPRKMEELVESVFRDFGFRTFLTPRSGDDGIDVLLYGPGDVTVGVEVKRYRNAITAEQIRSFTGALFLGDHVGGIYITTSNYEPGARRAARRAWEKGVLIHLVDADSLLDALRIAQRTILRSTEQLEELAVGLATRTDLLAHEYFS